MPLATRTGSEVALYNLICYAADKGFEIAVACRDDGELLARLPENVSVFVHTHWSWPQKVRAALHSRLEGKENSFTAAINKQFKPDLWYINTIVQPEYLKQAKENNIPCVVHTHELEQILHALTVTETEVLINYPRLVVAGSEAARKVFHSLGRQDDIDVCYATINPANIKWDAQKSRALRRSIGIGDRTFVWAMAGTLDPNKNPARFVEIAGQMLRSGLDVHFIWLGAGETGYSFYIKKRAQDSETKGKVSFLNAGTEDYYDWINAADGLVVTSLKESFSLVSVEAAYLGKPVVSFDCGGVKEIVREGMGSVIDSWNNADLISAMVAVMKGEIFFDPHLARQRVLEFSIDVQGPRWIDSIREHFPG